MKIWFQNRRTKWKKAEQEAAAQKSTAEKLTAADQPAVAGQGTEAKPTTEVDNHSSVGQPGAAEEYGDNKPAVIKAEKSKEVTEGSEKSSVSPTAVSDAELQAIGIPSAEKQNTEDLAEKTLNHPDEKDPKNPEAFIKKSSSPAPSSDGETANSSAHHKSGRDSTPAPPTNPTPQAVVPSPAASGATARPAAGRLLAGALGAGAGGRHRSGIAKLERLVFQREREAALCGES